MLLQTMKKLTALALATALAATPATAQPVQAEPAGRWTLDYGEMSCNLQRTFKADDVVHLLRFERKPLSNKMVLSILADTKGPSSDQKDNAKVMADHGKSASVQIHRVPLAERRPRYSMNLNAKRLELAGVKDHIAIDAGSMMTMQFKTGALEAPVAALEQCISDLYTDMSIDEATLENIEDYPEIDFRRLARYLPEESIDADLGGGLLGMLRVDADGKVADCTLVKPADPAMRAQVCEIIADKARLEPAKSKDGQAMAAPMFVEFSTVRRGSLLRN